MGTAWCCPGELKQPCQDHHLEGLRMVVSFCSDQNPSKYLLEFFKSPVTMALFHLGYNSGK